MDWVVDASVGVMDGVLVGVIDGVVVAYVEEVNVGNLEGDVVGIDGVLVGTFVGCPNGEMDGLIDGVSVGCVDGVMDVTYVGWFVMDVGVVEGDMVGFMDGDMVGVMLGDVVGVMLGVDVEYFVGVILGIFIFAWFRKHNLWQHILFHHLSELNTRSRMRICANG